MPISFFNEFSVLLLGFFLVHHCNINENVKCCLAKIFVYTTNLKHDNHKFSAVCPNILLAVYIISLFPTEALRFDHTDINFKRQSHSKPFIFNGDLMQHEQLRLNDFIQIHSDMMQWLPMRVQIVKKNCSWVPPVALSMNAPLNVPSCFSYTSLKWSSEHSGMAMEQ